MTDLAARIRAQLDAIPHAPECAWIITDGSDYRFSCDCDRDQRQAEAVARMAYDTWNRAPADMTQDEMEDAAVWALSSPSPECENRPVRRWGVGQGRAK